LVKSFLFCRDLKAENVLLAADGAWKLCDFGSVSTNHKIFDRPEEMGIEEDNIRKHTTPAYRAPEVGLFFNSFFKENREISKFPATFYFGLSVCGV
jgi:AP2-associated kinase